MSIICARLLIAQYHVRALRHDRKYVSEDIAKPIATSLVGARLDYCNAAQILINYNVQWKSAVNTIILHHYFPNYIGYRLKHVFVTRLQFWHSRRFRQASQAIWLNWPHLIHQKGNLYPLHVGLISYMFQTLETILEAELFYTLLQQCGKVCRRLSQILHFYSTHSSLG